MVNLGPGDARGDTDGGDDGSDGGGSSGGSSGGGDDVDPRRETERDVVTSAPDDDSDTTDTGGDGGDSSGGGDDVDPRRETERDVVTSAPDEDVSDSTDTSGDGGGDDVDPRRSIERDVVTSAPDDGSDTTDASPQDQTVVDVDPDRVEGADRTRLMAAQRQAERGSYNPDNPYTPTGDTSGLESLIGPIEDETGRNLQPGEDYTISGEGGDFQLNVAGEWIEDYSEEQQDIQETQATGTAAQPLPGGGYGVPDTVPSAVVTDLEQQVSEQTGRDVEAGEDFIIEQQGDSYGVSYTEEFRQEQAERSVEAQAGRDFITGLAGLTGPGATEAVRAGVPDEVARDFSPIQAGEDFEITTETVTGGQATAGMVGSAVVGGLPSDGMPEAGDTYQDVSFTESYRDGLQEAQQDTDPASMGIVEANLAGVDLILGPPGQLERDIGGAVEGSAQPVIGAPGDLEQQTIGTVTGPAGQLERDIGGVVEGAAQPVLGPKGQFERDLGSAVYSEAGVWADRAQVAREDYVTPFAEVSGDLAGLGQQSLRTISPTTYLLGGDPSEEIDRLGTAAGDVYRGEDQGDPTITESGTEGIIGGIGGLGAELTVGGPNVAVQLGDATFGAAGAVGENLSEEGIVGGTQATAATAGTVGATIAAGEARNIIQNPFKATGEAILGGGIARGIERGATAARVRYEGRGGPDVDAEDTTRQAEQVEAGESPEFETDPGAPTDEAVEEYAERAGEQPEDLQDLIGEEIALRSEADRLPGGEFPAEVGTYELPGLFAAADFSPLRWPGASGGLSSLTPRLPRPWGEPPRASALEIGDVEGMPDSATGARTIDDPDGTSMPDLETSGSEFLMDQAEEGTFYVRPPGSRTPELEAVTPPGTTFERVTTGTLESGGRRGTLDVYRLVDDAADGVDDVADDVDVDDVTGETYTIDEISSRMSRGNQPDGPPLVPPTTAPAATTDPVVDDYDTGSVFDDTTTTTTTTRDVSDADVSATSGATDPISGVSSDTATGTPTSTTSGTGTGTSTTGTSPTSGDPTSPTSPSGSPTDPTPTPTGPTSGGPTSGGPPTLGPPTAGGPTSGGPTTGGPTQTPPRISDPEDDEEELERFLDDDADEFDKLFEYDVVSPGEVLTGDDIVDNV